MTAKTNRLEVRVAPQSREQISLAAEEVNESISDFVRNAALERADKILALSNATSMPAEQFDALIRSLDQADAAPNLAKIAKEPRRFSPQ
ncbi:DUF1778 domain-containing protein [Mycobacterium sp.]|uniref:type II toxin-antitoxin system TacA family antitoxin n=1 Tax=Mycobacterium sp. TaxID=1785 RepID=UPI003D6A4676